MPTVLIIDDNPAVITALDVLFSLHDLHSGGLNCVGVHTPQQGLDYLAEHACDLVIQDMNFRRDTTSGEEGEELFAQIRQRHPDLPVILLTAWTHLDRAVALIKSGAADYHGKPWDDQRLLASVKNLLELRETQQALAQRVQRERQSRAQFLREHDLCGMVWQDAATERVLRLATQVARSTLPVLITGPNGAGKEGVAAVIQANSPVCKGPFVVLNCGALPGELIEAELFGAESGAYTGANRARAGKFEAADGGTLFLDEIGNLSLTGQMKLLRVLETGRFERLGSNREQQVSVRVISATNADLPAMVRAGQFREDLYYRINVIELALPALAQRPDDILPLARHFLGGEKQLSAAAVAALQAHAWPGNVRELKNVMQRVAVMVPGALVDAADLGLPVPAKAARVLSDEDLSREVIEASLQRCNGVLAQAAAELGLSRQSLYRRMERLSIARPGAETP